MRFHSLLLLIFAYTHLSVRPSVHPSVHLSIRPYVPHPLPRPLTPLLQLIIPSRASGTTDHVRSLDDLFITAPALPRDLGCRISGLVLYNTYFLNACFFPDVQMMSVCQSVSVSLCCLSLSISLCRYAFLSVNISVCLFIYLSVCLFVCSCLFTGLTAAPIKLIFGMHTQLLILQGIVLQAI